MIVHVELVCVGQGLTWFDEDREDERAMLARWTVAFSLATMAHLREDCNLEQDLQACLERYPSRLAGLS